MDGGETTSSGQNIEYAKCFICDITSIHCIPIIAESKHTKTRFSAFVRKFLNDIKSDRTIIINDDLNSHMLCDKCADKIDEYDLAYCTAERVAKEMCEILRKAEHSMGEQIDGNNHSENFEIFKMKTKITEIKIDCSLADASLDGNDFIDLNHTSTDKNDNDANDDEKTLSETNSKQNSPDTEPNMIKNAENDFNSNKNDKSQKIANQKRDAIEYTHLQCEICEKNFSGKKNLARHMRLHTDQNVKMTCEICKKVFIYKWSLKLHMQIHANFKEYSCECGKRFNRRDKMLEHRKTHDRTKVNAAKKDPYECNECSATFRILKEFKVKIFCECLILRFVLRYFMFAILFSETSNPTQTRRISISM